MNFYFKGETYDTDKHYYVAGYEIMKGSWFPLSLDETRSRVILERHPLVCKKCVIENIGFEFNNGQSFVNSVTLYSKKQHQSFDVSRHIVSHDPKILKKYVSDLQLKGEKI